MNTITNRKVRNGAYKLFSGLDDKRFLEEVTAMQEVLKDIGLIVVYNSSYDELRFRGAIDMSIMLPVNQIEVGTTRIEFDKYGTVVFDSSGNMLYKDPEYVCITPVDKMIKFYNRFNTWNISGNMPMISGHTVDKMTAFGVIDNRDLE